MGKFFRHLLTRGFLSLQQKNEVARFEGIGLADLRRKSSCFQTTLLAALQLIRDCDLRRFVRVQRRITWIVNCDLEFADAEYDYITRTCRADFQEPTPKSDLLWLVGLYARMLVHEATHGVIEARAIQYTPKLRARIEALCVTEEKRFRGRLALLQPEVAEKLYREFDESNWQVAWTASRWQRVSAILRNFLTP